MSGIDRLRTLAGAWDELGLGGTLADIADQIERERDAEVADSPYDAILPEDRDSLTWVRDHGGLDHINAEWRSRSNLARTCDKLRAKVERQQRHIEYVQGKCRERQGHIVELSKELAELRKVLSDYRDALGGMCERLGITDGTSTHTKPAPPDSLERIADEIDRLREEVALHLGDYLYDEDGNDSIQFSMELVAKRCRALAERERGE